VWHSAETMTAVLHIFRENILNYMHNYIMIN
jgi:hypothetical protein